MVAGTILIPFTFRCEYLLPEIITSLGLILSIIILIPLCNKNLDNVGTNVFQLILIIDIICSVIIFRKMFKRKGNAKNKKRSLNGIFCIIALICVFIFLLVYGISSFFAGINTDSGNSSKESSVSDDYKEDTELIVWDDFILGKNIPDFGYNEAEVVWDTKNVLILYFYNVESSKFESYIEECKNFGYTIDSEDDGVNYSAYNQDGYFLHLQYADDIDVKKLTIDLEDPIKNNLISWPNSELVKDLPVPKTLIGEVSIEESEAYSVYLTHSYFSEYVDLCMKNGFTIDYSKSDTYFSAENSKGISLTVEYKGFNTLNIYIENYDW